MSILHYSQNKAIRVALGVIVLLVLFPALFRIVFAEKDEVSFEAGTGISTCSDFFVRDQSDISYCTSTYEIAIGNTGTRNQEVIIIDLSPVPEEHRVSWNVLDIVATSRRPIGPRVSNQQIEGSLQFEIQDLEPNRLVEISLYTQGPEFKEAIEKIDIALSATGNIIETNPRTTVLLRLLKNLSGIFGF
jgi:hypothetical protein